MNTSSRKQRDQTQTASGALHVLDGGHRTMMVRFVHPVDGINDDASFGAQIVPHYASQVEVAVAPDSPVLARSSGTWTDALYDGLPETW